MTTPCPIIPRSRIPRWISSPNPARHHPKHLRAFPKLLLGLAFLVGFPGGTHLASSRAAEEFETAQSEPPRFRITSGLADLARRDRARRETLRSVGFYTNEGEILRAAPPAGADRTVSGSVNAAPSVWAGESQTLVVETETALPVTTDLAGRAEDDRRPGPLTVRWWQLGGPSSIGFGSPDSLETTAMFYEPGTYLLRLRADDTAATTDAHLVVRVVLDRPPRVEAGADQAITLPSGAELAGEVTDQTYPGSTAVTAHWSLADGPGPVDFTDPTSAATGASFSEPGTYRLRLTAEDGLHVSTDEVRIQVEPDPYRGPLEVSIDGIERDLPHPLDPTPESQIAGQVTVTASAAGAKSVEFQVCDPEGGACVRIGRDTSAPYRASWDTTAVANGDYTLRAVGRDRDGSTRGSDLVPVIIRQFFVTADGSAEGEGTLDSPWTAPHALGQPETVVPPGATIWFRGGPDAPGVYPGAGSNPGPLESTLEGSETAPIKVRPFPGEWARLDHPGGANPGDAGPTVSIGGRYTWFVGFEITSTALEARRAMDAPQPGTGSVEGEPGSGVALEGEGNRLINNVIHDSGAGVSVSGAGHQIYGNVITNNGWRDPNGVQSGDAFQVEQSDRPPLIEANLIGPQFGSGGVFRSGGSDTAADFEIRSNAWVDAARVRVGLPGTGTVGQTEGRVVDNFLYRSGLELGGAPGEAGDPDGRQITATGNYLGLAPIVVRFWDTARLTGNTSVAGDNPHLELWDPVASATLDENIYYRGGTFAYFPVGTEASPSMGIADWTVETGHDRASTYNLGQPPNHVALVRNAYDPRRANIVVYNWFLDPSVAVDVSALALEPGDTYELRNVVDYYGDVVSGVYDGSGQVRIPMSGHSVAAPAGEVDALRPSSFPEFGAFRFIRTSR